MTLSVSDSPLRKQVLAGGIGELLLHVTQYWVHATACVKVTASVYLKSECITMSSPTSSFEPGTLGPQESGLRFRNEDHIFLVSQPQIMEDTKTSVEIKGGGHTTNPGFSSKAFKSRCIRSQASRFTQMGPKQQWHWSDMGLRLFNEYGMDIVGLEIFRACRHNALSHDSHSNKPVIFFGLRGGFKNFGCGPLQKWHHMKSSFLSLSKRILDLNFGLHNWTPVYGAARRYYN
ncbi:hypothetical protein P692DRAFT_201806054 [Suillus brevipes Sb2]|nr:hypothetical protein P692DRAFT_201806054 [Suillus brevipes Sb2]